MKYPIRGMHNLQAAFRAGMSCTHQCREAKMKDRNTPIRGWRGARLAGIAAVLGSTIVVASGAVAAPGGEKGKPEPKSNTSQGTETSGGGGNAYGHGKATGKAPAPQPAPQPEPESQGQAKSKAPKPESESPVEAKADQPSSNGKGNSPAATNKSSGGTTKSATGPKKSQNAGTGDNPQGRGPSGKSEYCHATHSGTNPYVLIETNNNGLPAHRAHQDEEDIIPASGDCPGSSARGQSGGSKGGQQQSKAGGPDGKATYCHSTRSETNPFVVITTSVNALAAHIRHHAGDDIIPAVNGECPGGPAPTQQTTDKGAGETPVTPNGQGPIGDGPANQRPNEPAGPDGNGPQGNGNRPDGLEGDDQPDEMPAGSDDGDAPDDERVANQRTPGDDGPAEGDVLAENEAGGPGAVGPDEESAAPLAEETAGAPDDDDDSLPFTGFGVVAILAVALIALAGGAAARRAARRTDA